MDLLNLYGRASEWTLGKVAGATDKLDAATPCEEWQVRELLNHMLETQQFFTASARGQKASPPSQNPPELMGSDVVADFKQAHSETLSVFSEDGVLEKTGPTLGIAFSDELLHGWDLAKATGQDPTMPEGLAQAAYEVIHGRFTEEERKGVFGPEVTVDSSSSAQDKLLAYTGRDPD